jgi:5-methylthioadenosine/S-adenosylhomocysteine deaminase
MPTMSWQQPIDRRRLLGAGLTLGAGLWLPASRAADAAATLIFTHTTVVTNDVARREFTDVALVVQDGLVAAIGPTDELLAAYPGADRFDGRQKALLPGLINCHAHLAQTLERGFNEDFGFPNSVKLAVTPRSQLSQEEQTLMAVVGALEGIRCGTTTMVQVADGIAAAAPELARSGQRWVFAENVRDKANGAGAISPETLAASTPPQFSDAMRASGMQRVSDLHSAWHGADNGRISVFPAAGVIEDASPELLRAIRDFAERHDLGYTIHLNQSTWEVEYMQRYHGLRPTEFLHKHEFLGPRLFAAHCRYVNDAEIALLGSTRTIVSHQAAMAANRGVSPPIVALRDAGCPIALGTDNNNNDIFEVMRVAMLLERIQRSDERPGLLPQPEDVLDDAVRGGAVAVNQASQLGSLEIGKKADLLVLDTLSPHLTPHGRILSAWVHNGQPADIEAVMVEGRFLMRDRKVLTLDEDLIMAEAERVGRRAWQRALENGPVPLPRRG